MQGNRQFTLLLSTFLSNTQNSFKIIVLYVAMMAICLGLATLVLQRHTSGKEDFSGIQP